MQPSIYRNLEPALPAGMSATEYDIIQNAKLAGLLEAIEQENVENLREILGKNPELLEISFVDREAPVTREIPEHTFNILGYAASLCKLRAITILIDEFDADPNQAAHIGLAPLHQLVRADKGGCEPSSDIYKTAELLVKKGADPNMKLSAVYDYKTPTFNFDFSPRSYAERTAPSVIGLAFNGMKDNAQGANCRAVFSRKDSDLLTFSYQLQRNAVPIAGAAAVVAIGMAMKA